MPHPREQEQDDPEQYHDEQGPLIVPLTITQTSVSNKNRIQGWYKRRCEALALVLMVVSLSLLFLLLLYSNNNRIGPHNIKSFKQQPSIHKKSIEKNIGQHNSTVCANSPQYLEVALAELRHFLHDDPQRHALRPYRWISKDGKDCYDFEGLTANILQQTLGDRKLFLLGDSTLYHMSLWLRRLLHKIDSHQMRDNLVMASTSLNDANARITHYSSHGRPLEWENKILHRSTDYDDTSTMYSVVWDGHAGFPGKLACHMFNEFDHVLELEPQILVVNFGLHWMHFQGFGRNVHLCYVQRWIYYEHFLQQAYDAAVDSGTRLLLYKTTNFICEDLYRGVYAHTLTMAAQERAALLSSQRGDNLTTASLQPGGLFATCVQDLQAALQEEENQSINLSESQLLEYCVHGTFDEYGSSYLNQRVFKFVRAKQEQQRQQAAALQKHNENATRTFGNSIHSMTVEIFNDHELESCPYSAVEDGRHYQPLNLMRIRYLANMIQAYYDFDYDSPTKKDDDDAYYYYNY